LGRRRMAAMGNYTYTEIEYSPTVTFTNYSCSSSGTVIIPSSAYPSSGNYGVNSETYNYTSSITNATGMFYATNVDTISVTE
jgi:hypothetical protein